MFNRVYSPLLYLLLCLPAVLPAQIFPITNGGTVDACTGFLTDAGGPGGDHSPAGAREIITICSDGSGDDTHVQLDFSEIAIEGILTIFDGPDATADTLRQLTAASNGSQVVVAATSANASGCLTVEFRSAGLGAGWVADIACTAVCQPVIAEIALSTPEANPATGYLDVCVGDPITFTGRGSYPQNGANYVQADASSTFRWDFQNGDTREGPSVTYAFTESGGYTVSLTITDANGCQSSNRVGLPVRVAPQPVFAPAAAPPSAICPGESVTLTVGGAASVADPRPGTGSFQRSESFSETIAIPDDVGRTYSSGLQVDLFENADRITGPEVIREVCVTMEHSFLGDLDLYVECPDGQRLYLMNVDENSANPSYARMGYGTRENTDPEPPLTYCWSADAAETVYEVATDLALPSPDVAVLPADRNYRPLDQGFNSLTGCALNGRWTLNAVDNFPEDQGTVYNWTIRFSDELLPGLIDYTIPIVSTRWFDNGKLDNYGSAEVVYRGNDPGFHQQRLEVEDSIGCVYDTLYRIDIRSPYAPDCFECPDRATPDVIDTVVCEGNELILDIDAPFDSAEVITWRAYEDRPYAGQLVSGLAVTDQVPALIQNAASTAQQVCVELSAAGGLESTEISLRAPDDTYLVLAARGSLSGTELQRCFSAVEVTGWSDLEGGPVNGTWSLVVDNGSESPARLTEWSLDLLRQPDITYNWSPASPDFSCTDCLDPVITPTASGSYTLTVSSSDGCTESVRLDLEVIDSEYDFTATLNGGCAGADNGFIDLEPEGSPGAATYSWSNGATTQDLSGLAPGTYELTVTSAGSCTRTFSYTLPAPDNLDFVVDSVVGVGCSGTADGGIFTSVTGGTAPYTYTWSDPSLSGGDAGAVSAGSYTVTVTDSIGCSATLVVEVPAATELLVSVGVTDVTCAGQSDGSATVSVTGGSGAEEIRWEGYPNGPEQNDLPAGTYRFTVTDGSGCIVRDSAVIRAPAPLVVSAETTLADCGGSTAGSIRLTVSGGTEPYTYSWQDGSTGPSREDLSAGTYAVTVTDANACVYEESFSLSETEPLELTGTAVAPVCEGEATGYIDPVGSGGNPPYLYSLDGNAFVSTDRFENLDDRVYLVFVKDATGCVVTRELTVPAAPDFNLSLGPDIELTYGDSVRLVPVITGGSGELLYSWTTTDPSVLDCRDCPSPVARPEYESGVSLLVADTLGCTAEDVLRIRVRKIREVAVPTGFSPNGDGNNDRLVVLGRPGTRVVNFAVFDRWGGKLYEADDFFVNDETVGWDGNDSTGRPQNTGVYLYKTTVEFEDGSRETRSGQTTLIR